MSKYGSFCNKIVTIKHLLLLSTLISTSFSTSLWNRVISPCMDGNFEVSVNVMRYSLPCWSLPYSGKLKSLSGVSACIFMFASHESVIIYLKHSNTAMALMPITQILVRPSESLMTLRSRYSIQNRIAPHTHDASRIFVCLSIDRPLFSDHICAVDSTGAKIRHSLFR